MLVAILTFRFGTMASRSESVTSALQRAVAAMPRRPVPAPSSKTRGWGEGGLGTLEEEVNEQRAGRCGRSWWRRLARR